MISTVQYDPIRLLHFLEIILFNVLNGSNTMLFDMKTKSVCNMSTVKKNINITTKLK